VNLPEMASIADLPGLSASGARSMRPVPTIQALGFNDARPSTDDDAGSDGCGAGVCVWPGSHLPAKPIDVRGQG
jgi:hypothetical protein